MTYQRITPEDSVLLFNLSQNADNTQLYNYAYRLWELENQIAKGELLKLPCKVGDTVYRLHRSIKEIVEWEVMGVKLSKGETIFTCGHSGTKDYCAFGEAEIGEYFFTDKAEVGQRLRELENNP